MRFSDYIDPDEGQPEPEPFFAIADTCESCGEPCTERTWNAEYELWMGTTCSCNTPDEPVCPALLAILEPARTVGEVMDACKAHRRNCPVCNEAAARPMGRETQRATTGRMEAA